MGDVVKTILSGVVLGAIAFFTGGAGVGLLGTTTLFGSVAAGALLGGISGVLGILARPKLPDLSADFGQEVLLSGDPMAPRRVCYGEAWTGGVLRFRGTVGTDNEDLYLVIVLAGHEIDSVQAVEADGDALTLDGSGNVTSPSRWSGLMNVRFHLGTDDQAADSTLDSAFVTWTSNHRLRGIAYAVVKLTFDEEDLNNIPQFRFKIRGRKVYDPRLDSTNGGTGTHRLNDPSTWEWSRNAALCAVDFMRGVKLAMGTSPETYRAIAGLRISDNRIDWAGVIAEANVCDEDVELAGGASPIVTQKRYCVDGFIDPRQDHSSNLRHFEAAMAGDITFADGKWRVFAGAYRAPTLHLEDKHFIGPLKQTVHKGEADQVDMAQGVFASASDSGDVLDYPPVRLASATTGSERIMRLDFALVSDGAQAQRCAKLMLEREAAGKRITCTTSLYGYRAVPGETINVSRLSFGLTEQPMRVLDVQLTTVRDGDKVGLAVNLVLEAGPESLYAWDAEETAIAAAPAIPRAQVPFAISIPGLFANLSNSLINPSFEAGDTGWTPDANWTIVEDAANARFGSWVAKLTNGGSNQRIRNHAVIQVDEGDRVLAQAHCKRTGGTGDLRVRIQWMQADGTEISRTQGNGVTSSSYEISRAVGVAPSGAVIARLDIWQATATGTSGYADGAYMAIIPRDSDIDIGEVTGKIVEDPKIKSGASFWELIDSSFYLTGEGTNGTDAIRLQATSVPRRFYAAARRNPTLDTPVTDGMSIIVRWRAKLNDPGVGGAWTQHLHAEIKVTDEDGSNPSTFRASGSRTWSASDDTDEWYNDTATVIIRDTSTTPRYLQVGLMTIDNLLGPEWYIDFLDASIGPTPFGGSEKPGIMFGNISTSDPTGTPVDGEIWIKHES
jgi:hypothetical protein